MGMKDIFKRINESRKWKKYVVRTAETKLRVLPKHSVTRTGGCYIYILVKFRICGENRKQILIGASVRME